MDGWMDILSFAGGYSLGPRHLALAAQRPNLLHVQTSAYGHRTTTGAPRVASHEGRTRHGHWH